MIGPLTGFSFWVAGFALEILLWSLLCFFLYDFLCRYKITRYLIAYPGTILLWNLGGWIICFCVWLVYMLFGCIYDVMIADVDPNTPYAERLSTFMSISTVVISFFALRLIYTQEKEYIKMGK